jgi:hypothetical protein
VCQPKRSAGHSEGVGAPAEVTRTSRSTRATSRTLWLRWGRRPGHVALQRALAARPQGHLRLNDDARRGRGKAPGGRAVGGRGGLGEEIALRCLAGSRQAGPDRSRSPRNSPKAVLTSAPGFWSRQLANSVMGHPGGYGVDAVADTRPSPLYSRMHSTASRHQYGAIERDPASAFPGRSIWAGVPGSGSDRRIAVASTTPLSAARRSSSGSRATSHRRSRMSSATGC